MGRIGTDSARVVEVNKLPPAADGRTFRAEVVLRLSKRYDGPPDESDVRAVADELLAEIEEITREIVAEAEDEAGDEEEWDGPDELYIQLYAPGRDTDAGACGTAHWLDGRGYEEIAVRPYFF